MQPDKDERWEIYALVGRDDFRWWWRLVGLVVDSVDVGWICFIDKIICILRRLILLVGKCRLNFATLVGF